jgi:hypothetical protein
METVIPATRCNENHCERGGGTTIFSKRMLADMIGSPCHLRIDHHQFPWQELLLARVSLIQRVDSHRR